MPSQRIVTRVWIETGCITCDACETALPSVFEVQESTCTIRSEALDAEFLRPLSGAVADAALECPVEVIKFESVDIEVAGLRAIRATA